MSEERKFPAVGERVYVRPYTVPGHEQPAYAGTVVHVHGPDEAGRYSVFLGECSGDRGRSRVEWLHFISGYEGWRP